MAFKHTLKDVDTLQQLTEIHPHFQPISVTKSLRSIEDSYKTGLSNFLHLNSPWRMTTTLLSTPTKSSNTQGSSTSPADTKN